MPGSGDQLRDRVDRDFPVVDSAYVLGKGRVQWQGASAALVADSEVQKAWLGI